MLPQDSFRKHAVTNTPANSRSARFALFLRDGSLPVLKPGRRSHYMILGLAQCSFALLPVRSLTPFKGAFSTEGSGRLVASSPAPIATGWSEICRMGPYLSHWSPAPFSRRTWIGMHPTHENLVAECQQCGADKHAEDALGCHATQCADQYHRHRRLDTASQK